MLTLTILAQMSLLANEIKMYHFTSDVHLTAPHSGHKIFYKYKLNVSNMKKAGPKAEILIDPTSSAV